MARGRIASLAAAALWVAGCSSTSTGVPSASVQTSLAPTTTSSASPSPSGVSPSASGSATASTSSTTFTSPFYGYTVTLPPGWTATPATEKWDGKGAPGNDDPAVDKFAGQGSASMHAFAAPKSLDLAGYAADVIARNVQFHSDTCPPKPESVESATVGSDPATFIAWNCGILINLVVTLHGGTGYEFVFRDPGVHEATDTTDRTTFDSLLETVSFAP